MTMKNQIRILAALLGLLLLPGVAKPDQTPFQEYYRRVFLVHLSGGPALPIAEEGLDEHDLGFNIGLGLGFMLSSGGPVAPELVFRFNFYRLPRSLTTDRFILNEADNEYSYSVEGRFRYLTKSRFRPYGLVGVGLYDQGDETAKTKGMVTVGGGMDWGADRKESVLLFSELRFVAGPRNMLRLDFGIRVG